MPLPSGASIISDSRRDAEKYHNLLLAIENATRTINTLERDGRASIDRVLESLLPHLIEALDAAQAFVAVHHNNGKSNGSQAFKLISAYPKLNSAIDFLPWSSTLGKILSSPRARVIEPFDDAQKLIHGLEMFNATTAILMQMQIGSQSRIVGVCNRTKSEMGPFLGTDRRALESIIELIAIGMRVGERRRQELENIQNISAAINEQLNPDELLPRIARKAAEVFNAPAASLMLWDKKRDNLVIGAHYGLSPDYVKRQRIPRKSLHSAFAKYENIRAIVTADLRKNPFGKPDLIRSERLRSALTAKLQVSDEMIGILNIYSQDTLRAFTESELELAEIFANQAAIAIYNARLYDEVKKTKDYLLASQTVAWLGLVSADLQHTIHQKAFSLENIATGLQTWLNRLESPPEDIEDVFSILEHLNTLAKSIRTLQPASEARLDLPGEAGTYTVIDEELSAICEKLTQDHPHIEKHINLNCPKIKAMIAPEGLMIAMEKLVNNAIKAMQNDGHLSICSERVGKMIHVRIKDSGGGIPEESLPYFLKRMLSRRRSDGTGVGVLIARFVALSHGGDLELVSTSSTGTELLLTLPIVTE